MRRWLDVLKGKSLNIRFIIRMSYMVLCFIIFSIELNLLEVTFTFRYITFLCSTQCPANSVLIVKPYGVWRNIEIFD